jgi:hypothetical protein
MIPRPLYPVGRPQVGLRSFSLRDRSPDSEVDNKISFLFYFIFPDGGQAEEDLYYCKLP